MIVRTEREAISNTQSLKCTFELGMWEDGDDPETLTEIENMFLGLFVQLTIPMLSPCKVRALREGVFQAVANWRKAYMEELENETGT